jgi:hypothetical protein
MFLSPILDVVAGVLFAFMSISLAASAINEALASFLNLRGKGMLKGIQNMLNGQPGSDAAQLVLAIYNNALVHPQGDGKADDIQALGTKGLPSYVEPAKFAAALVDSLANPAASEPPADSEAPAPPILVKLELAIQNIKDAQLKRTLLALYDRADGKIEVFEAAAASWFDGTMDRVSGVYKRNCQVWAFFIALVIVLLLNVDTLFLAKTLWQNPGAAQHLTVPTALPTGGATLQQLQNHLPIGWTDEYMTDRAVWWAWPIAIVGWLITALSTLFGAPFWFDLLQKVVQLRNSGPTPAEKAKAQAASG